MEAAQTETGSLKEKIEALEKANADAATEKAQTDQRLKELEDSNAALVKALDDLNQWKQQVVSMPLATTLSTVKGSKKRLP